MANGLDDLRRLVTVAEAASTVEARLQAIKSAIRLKAAQVRAIELLHNTSMIGSTEAYGVLDMIGGEDL